MVDLAIGFLRRRYLYIAICLPVSLAVCAVYLFVATPTYTASATMMIETRQPQVQQLLFDSAPAPDSAWIESEIGILKSRDVVAYVVKQLKLADDDQFLRADPGPVDRLLARLGWRSPPPQTDAAREARAVDIVSSHLNVHRIGASYLIGIDFSSSNAALAVKVANGVIDGYIFDQLNSKYQANRRAGDWLQERLQALREQAAAAEQAVVDFKAKNNIVATGGGTLMNEKQLSDINSQLAAARTHTSDLQARVDRIEAVRQAYQQDQPAAGADETISDALTSPIITTLRNKYLDLVNREADWSVKYGKDHIAVVNLRNQIRDIRRSIYDELGRIEESYRSELDIAKQRQSELEQGLGTLISQTTTTNQAQSTLFSLEAAAQSYRKLYDDFLHRYTESVQQQTYPISDARSVSAAGVIQISPQPSKAWALSIFAGMIFGVGFGALREIMDRGFRTKDQVRTALETDCLAMIPVPCDELAQSDFLRPLVHFNRETHRRQIGVKGRQFGPGYASRDG